MLYNVTSRRVRVTIVAVEKQCFLLLQSALQPLWVLAGSTIVEYSQQEGFYRVPLPAAHETSNLEDQ